MPNFRFNGVNVHYTEHGTGEPVVLLHSRGASAAQWRGVNQHWVDKKSNGTGKLLALDLYGHGKTDPWAGEIPATADDEAQLVKALIDECGGKAHLAGHSFGGGVALRAAVMHPRQLLSLTLIEPMAMPLLIEAGEETLFEEHARVGDALVEAAARGAPEEGWARFIDYSNGDGTWAAMSGSARARILARSDAAVAGVSTARGLKTTLNDCRALNMPVLVIRGENTRPPLRRLTEVLAETIPHAQFTEIAGAGHMSPLTHPAPVAAAIRAHVDAAGSRS